jgi:hypothetical protein
MKPNDETPAAPGLQREEIGSTWKRNLSGRAKRLREQFTFIKPCCVEGEPDAHTTWIKVGVQSFSLSGYQETKESAEWYRDMLALAFETIIESEKLISSGKPESTDAEGKERASSLPQSPKATEEE